MRLELLSGPFEGGRLLGPPSRRPPSRRMGKLDGPLIGGADEILAGAFDGPFPGAFEGPFGGCDLGGGCDPGRTEIGSSVDGVVGGGGGTLGAAGKTELRISSFSSSS